MNRQKIIKELQKRPLTFTELKNRTGLENGVIQHHVRGSNRIEKEKEALMLKNECEKCRLKGLCQKKCVKSLLSNDRKRYMAENIGEKSQAEIARDMNLSRATVSYHISSLEEQGVLTNGELVEEVKDFLQN